MKKRKNIKSTKKYLQVFLGSNQYVQNCQNVQWPTLFYCSWVHTFSTFIQEFISKINSFIEINSWNSTFFIKNRVVGRGIANVLLINEVTICIKKGVFCTERHSLRYGGLVVKFVQFYKDPGEMHTCRNKSIRLWTCIFLPTNVSTSPLSTINEPYFFPSLSFDPYPFLPLLSPLPIKNSFIFGPFLSYSQGVDV